MATLVLYSDMARIVREVIEQIESGDYAEGQITLNDSRGVPLDIVIRGEEVEHE